MMNKWIVIVLSVVLISTALCSCEKDNCSSPRVMNILYMPHAECHPVDLELPSGLLWAAGNIGAESPWSSGLYFAWGETKGLSEGQVVSGVRRFNVKTYKVDSLLCALSSDVDAARINLGEKWRMPTQKDFEELLENTTWEWVKTGAKQGGIYGWLVTSKKNSNYIFFPAAGYCVDEFCFNTGISGFYWFPNGKDPEYARSLYMNSDGMFLSYDNKCYGFNIRGVCK